MGPGDKGQSELRRSCFHYLICELTAKKNFFRQAIEFTMQLTPRRSDSEFQGEKSVTYELENERTIWPLIPAPSPIPLWTKVPSL